MAGDALRGLADERVVRFMAGQGGRVGPALGGAQDVELALGYAAAFTVEPDEGIIVLGGTQVDERAVGLRGRGLAGLGGVGDGGHLFDRLLETGFAVGGVVPDLVGVGGEIDLGVVVAVEDAGLFVVEVVNGAGVFVLEKGFIGADDFGILVKSCAYAGAQPDQAFDALGGEERVAEDVLRLLANAVDAAGALDEADDGPGQVEVDDDGAVLEVLAFAEHIGGDEDAQLLVRRNLVALAVGIGAEKPGQLGGIGTGPCNGGKALNAGGVELACEVLDGVGELGEYEDFFAGMGGHKDLPQRGELASWAGSHCPNLTKMLRRVLASERRCWCRASEKRCGLSNGSGGGSVL